MSFYFNAFMKHHHVCTPMNKNAIYDYFSLFCVCVLSVDFPLAVLGGGCCFPAATAAAAAAAANSDVEEEEEEGTKLTLILIGCTTGMVANTLIPLKTIKIK
uniref:Uncharacterized protein n=1 Tax=Glossina austeni TaxID=7395 RepID=A0A1A9VAI1_GLOAU